MTRQGLLAAIAPLALCAVAALHLCGVVFADLSAWKGGGFGMFSTVDAPHSRFLRVALITEEGEIWIVTPPRWAKQVRKIRTMPTERLIAALGRELLESDWTGYEIVSAEESYRTAVEPQTAIPATQDDNGARRKRLDMGQFGFVQAVDDLEAEHRATELLNVRAVRIEVWRYRFDQDIGALRAQVLRDATFTRST